MQKQTFIILGSNGKSILIDVTFKDDGKVKPMVLFCHGFKGFKDWACLNLMAEAFAEHNYVFVKFNFSHNGTTLEKPFDFADLETFGNNSLGKELVDIQCVLDFLFQKNHSFSKQANLLDLTMIGHSRGGGMSVLTAAKDERIKRLVTFAAVAEFEALFDKKSLDKWKKEGVIYVYNTRTLQNMPLYYPQAEEFYSNLEKFNVLKSASKLSIPWLIIHGTNDETVPVSNGLKLKSVNEKAELLTIKGANHTFGASHPWEKSSMPADFELIVKESICFLSKHTE